MYSDIHTTLAVAHVADLRREAGAASFRASALRSLDRCVSLGCRVQSSAGHALASLRRAVRRRPATCGC